jgi:predicted nuclease of predicted toxin-antitoxin system
MARLPVDMNLSIEWIPLLTTAGHEAVHWSEVGDPRAPDTALMRWALDNAHTVFTHDLDFGTMLALSGADGPSVLQVLSLLWTYGDELERGVRVVADERRQRVRILPLTTA